MAARYRQLAAELKQLCLSLQQQGQSRLPGELALCEAYHCSRETVRRALALLEEEGFILRMHGSGTYLAGGPARGRRIAVVTAARDTYLYPQLLRDLERVFSAQGFSMEAIATGGRVMTERAALERLAAAPPAGILLEAAKSALPSPNLDVLARIEALRIPLVWLYAALPVPAGAPCLRDDDAGGARMLTRYLLDKGHRHIAAVNAGRDEWMYAFIRRRLPGCSAVVCYSDEIAYPLIHCLRAEGLRVPEDVAVVSFDNSHYCTAGPVSITSLAHERHELGSLAAGMLLDRIRARHVDDALLPWTLRERESG